MPEKIIEQLGDVRTTRSRRWRPGRHKSALKAVAHKTNNQASVGGSVLRANMQLEASEDLARHVDRTGMH